MPCTPCGDGKYKWGEDGPCEFDSLEACQKAHEGEADAAGVSVAEGCANCGPQSEVVDLEERRSIPSAGTRRWFALAVDEEQKDVADLNVFDTIGGWFDGVSAKAFVTELQALPENVATIRLHVNSPGGDVFDAIHIANSLRAHKARVVTTIEGLAASAATIVTQGGSDEVRVADNAMVMIHNPWMLAIGNAEEMRRSADTLDRITEAIVATYRRRSKKKEDTLRNMMDAETWMTADEAVANGFADAKYDGAQVAASADRRVLDAFRHVPASVLAASEAAGIKVKSLGEAVLEVKIDATELDEAVKAVAALAALDSPAPAAPQVRAEDVLAACVGAGLDAAFALELVKGAKDPDEVQAAIGTESARREAEARRRAEVTALCKRSGLEKVGDVLARAGVSAADAGLVVTEVKAAIDRVEIDSGLSPAHREGQTRATIRTIDVYASRNKLVN